MALRKRKMIAIVGGLLVLVVGVSVLEFSYRPSRSPYGQAILDSRPAGYWNLGELGGARVHDALEGKPAGRFRGSIGFGTGGAIASGPDTAVQLDGQGGAIALGAPVPDVERSSFAFWLRPDDGAALGALHASWRPPPEGPAALLPWLVASQTTRALAWTITFEPPNRLSVDYRRRRDAHAARASARLEPGRFSFVVLTLGRAGPRLWINGRPASARSRRIRSFPVGPSSPLTFGGRPGVGLKSFAGTIDDIAAFARPLRSAEIGRLWRVARSDCRACSG